VHIAWVADGATCRDRRVSDTRDCPLLFKFFGFRQFYSQGLNYFQTRLFKTVLGKAALSEGLLYPTKLLKLFLIS
jgi:hypothetical protein